MVGPPPNSTPKAMWRRLESAACADPFESKSVGRSDVVEDPQCEASEGSSQPDQELKSAGTIDSDNWQQLLDISPGPGLRSSGKARSALSWADLSETTDDCLPTACNSSTISTSLEESGSDSPPISTVGVESNGNLEWSGNADLAQSWSASEVSQSDELELDQNEVQSADLVASASASVSAVSLTALAGAIQDDAVARARRAVQARFQQTVGNTWQSPWHEVPDPTFANFGGEGEHASEVGEHHERVHRSDCGDYQMSMESASQHCYAHVGAADMQYIAVPVVPALVSVAEDASQGQVVEIYPMQGCTNEECWSELSRILVAPAAVAVQCQDEQPPDAQLQSNEHQEHQSHLPMHEQPLQDTEQHDEQSDQHQEQPTQELEQLQSEQPYLQQAMVQQLPEHMPQQHCQLVVADGWSAVGETDCVYSGQYNCDNMMWSAVGIEDYCMVSDFSGEMCGNSQYSAHMSSGSYSADMGDMSWCFYNSDAQQQGTEDRLRQMPDEVDIPPDQVTTVMVRNIPNKYTGPMLVQELNLLGFKRKFNFVYVPMDQTKAEGQASSWNVGYAFVNFISPEFAKKCEEKLTDYKFVRFRQRRETRVLPARLQGLRANLEHYRRTSVQFHKFPGHRPLIVAEGLQEDELPDASCFEHITFTGE